MKYTLLEIVQSVLTSIDGDEVNSITDTTEAMDIAKITKDCYFDIVSRANLPENYFHFGLDASGDNTKPVLMTLPDTAHNALWIKYDARLNSEVDPRYVDVQFRELKDFLTETYQLRESSDMSVDSFIYTVNGEDLKVFYKNNTAPRFYTVLADRTVVFNSFDNTVDSTLQKNKTLCYGERIVPFTLADAFVPVLDARQFPLLLNEVKATAWAEKKQTTNQRAETKAREGWINLQRTKHNVPGDKGLWQSIRYNYGR